MQFMLGTRYQWANFQVIGLKSKPQDDTNVYITIGFEILPTSKDKFGYLSSQKDTTLLSFPKA